MKQPRQSTHQPESRPDLPRVRTGLENFLAEEARRRKGERLGLVCNPASVDSRLRHALDLFRDHSGVSLAAVFGPQHGLHGQTQDNMIEWEGGEIGGPIPVFSLYGKDRAPNEAMLSGLDALVFDLQDVGARYYTFVQTLSLCLQACSNQGIRLIVLDRPNPINGRDVEGPLLDPRFASFVGLHPLPIRHGMTIAEVALYLNAEFAMGCDLQVVPMSGWSRGSFFPQTGLPWVMPSPNMPTFDTALVYPGVCLLEGTNVSEGRGTTRPFEISGAPWVDPQRLRILLEQSDLPGVAFRPLYFEPTFHKFQGLTVGGIQIHVVDKARFRPFRTGMALVKAYRDLGGDQFAWKEPPYEYEFVKKPFDILCGTDRIRRQLEEGRGIAEIESSWQEDLKAFLELRARHLLYRDGDEG